MSRNPRILSKPVIGLAGGIGAGKSVVARVFESLGAAIVDSDRQGHEQLGDPEVVATLRLWWGDSICTAGGVIDRKVVAGIVFEDPAQLKRLEEYLYPRIERCREALFLRYDADPAIRAIVLDSPKLFESGLSETCDAVVFVDASREVRLARLDRARGWTAQELDRREKLQNPLDRKKAAADHIVDNHSSIARLEPCVERILSSVIASFSP